MRSIDPLFLVELNGVEGFHRPSLKLLREQHLPVKQAAWRLGFSDPAALSRAFKRWTGAAPSFERAV